MVNQGASQSVKDVERHRVLASEWCSAKHIEQFSLRKEPAESMDQLERAKRIKPSMKMAGQRMRIARNRPDPAQRGWKAEIGDLPIQTRRIDSVLKFRGCAQVLLGILPRFILGQPVERCQPH